MDGMIRHGLGLAILGLVSGSLAVGAARAHSKDHPPAPCYIWKLVEIQETVYDIEWKEEEKEVCRPVIKEVRVPMSCKVCKPVEKVVLKPVCLPRYEQTKEPVTTEVHRTVKDECGCCHDTVEFCQNVSTCIVKSMVPCMIPVVCFEPVPMEHKWEEVYFKQEMEKVKVKIRTPVKKARTITIKKWTKVPYCPPCCETCETCEAGCGEGCPSCGK